jgi:rhomboid protease GluP
MNQNQTTPQETPLPPIAQGVQSVMRPFRPYTTYVLIGICVVVYLLQAATSYFPKFDVTSALVKDNNLILQGQFWRLFTPMFLHGSILHIGFNMYALFYIGPMVERFYGRWRYLVLFILSGFAGNVFSFMFTQAQSLGSSTAIFGLLGAQGVLIYQNREIFGAIARRILSQVVIVAVANLILGLSPGIDNWGHVGGLIAGTLFAWFGGPLLQRQGVVPPYSLLRDARGKREVIRAGIGVGALFFFLTIVAMFMKRG